MDAPGRSVMRLAMSPPVQLSAAERVSPRSSSAAETTCSRLSTSTP